MQIDPRLRQIRPMDYLAVDGLYWSGMYLDKASYTGVSHLARCSHGYTHVCQVRARI